MGQLTPEQLVNYFDNVYKENQDLGFVSGFSYIGQYGTEEPLEVGLGPIDPEMDHLDEILEQYEGTDLGHQITPATLRDLDMIQRGHDAMSAERLLGQNMQAAIKLALNSLAYRGETRDFGLNEVLGLANRVTRFAGAFTSVSHEVLGRAHSRLEVFSSPVAVETVHGDRVVGRIEAWGSMKRYGKIGLGILVEMPDAQKTVVDVGHDKFELLV